jgi:Domain of unknown function (DUF4189)
MTALLQPFRHLLIAVVAVALGMTATLAAAAPASAESGSTSPSERGRNYYGAIALSVDGAGGIANDKRTKARAKRVAKKQCKRRSNYPGKCEVGVWVRNACGAISVKRNSDGFITRYAWAVRRYKRPAVRAAQRKCGRKCQRYAWVCTTRRF